ATGLRNTSSSERSKIVRIFSVPSAKLLRLTMTRPRNCLRCHSFLARYLPHQRPATKDTTVVPKKMTTAVTTRLMSRSSRIARGIVLLLAAGPPSPGAGREEEDRESVRPGAGLPEDGVEGVAHGPRHLVDVNLGAALLQRFAKALLRLVRPLDAAEHQAG